MKEIALGVTTLPGTSGLLVYSYLALKASCYLGSRYRHIEVVFVSSTSRSYLAPVVSNSPEWR
jgi:hypothetical protein